MNNRVTRRDVLRQVGAVVAATALPGAPSSEAQAPAGPSPAVKFFPGFKPLTLQSIVIQTSRSTEIVVQFQIAGVSEEITVAGRTSVVETTSTTVSNRIGAHGMSKSQTP